MRRRSRRNPISSGQTAALVGLGVVLIGAAGYLIYKGQSSSSAVGSGSAPLPGSPTNYGTYTGQGGSSASGLPGVDSSGNDYEAGAGADAPLVSTAGA